MSHPPRCACWWALICAVYQFTSSSCSVPRNTPLAGPPQATRVRRPARTAHSCHAPAPGAAASTRSELRHALHTARTRPPRDTRTPHLRRRAHPPEPAATCVATAFVPSPAITARRCAGGFSPSSTTSLSAQVTQKEAQGGIDKVVQALRRDRSAKTELGNLTKVNNVLGFGSPKPNELAVRFNASFQKGGMGPFGLGQTNESEGRGTMVGQVKASIDISTGKVISCSVFRDLGYGRAYEMKC